MFFHSNEINQNSAVVPGNTSYAITTKYGRKVIVVLNSHLGGINRKLFSDSLPKCRSCLKYFSGARTTKTLLYNSNIERLNTRYSCHTHRFQWYWFLTITS